jgi:hypothetical protein
MPDSQLTLQSGFSFFASCGDRRRRLQTIFRLQVSDLWLLSPDEAKKAFQPVKSSSFISKIFNQIYDCAPVQKDLFNNRLIKKPLAFN